MTPVETPETILEPRNSSEVSMDQSPGSPAAQESAVPAAPGCESTAEDSENQLRLFVALLTVRVLTKCHALQNRRQEEWVAHTKRLVNQTMEGLAEIQRLLPGRQKHQKGLQGCGERSAEEALHQAPAGVCKRIAESSSGRDHRPVFAGQTAGRSPPHRQRHLPQHLERRAAGGGFR
ncbi:hypothetical protein L3Q82_003965 [Scortum barcoo]|uniref:Uncharacterized protein n=1 Tax=Scortum barcoo TaxID=214431 RepID=A0ACB8X6T7_9TELE|nr:hypothetical protein L3Q82_003965 [Scortum barcoo]